MKYIRTKDGRIIDLKYWSSIETVCVNAETDEVKKDICYQRTWFEQHGDTCEYKTEYISHNNQALKEADTIEDLCDKFVWFTAPHYYEIYDDFEDIEDCYHAENVTAIYGAIWTNKGLIFVAKLKERKLELL